MLRSPFTAARPTHEDPFALFEDEPLRDPSRAHWPPHVAELLENQPALRRAAHQTLRDGRASPAGPQRLRYTQRFLDPALPFAELQLEVSTRPMVITAFLELPGRRPSPSAPEFRERLAARGPCGFTHHAEARLVERRIPVALVHLALELGHASRDTRHTDRYHLVLDPAQMSPEQRLRMLAASSSPLLDERSRPLTLHVVVSLAPCVLALRYTQTPLHLTPRQQAA